jgi:hypothetical protein
VVTLQGKFLSRGALSFIETLLALSGQPGLQRGLLVGEV